MNKKYKKMFEWVDFMNSYLNIACLACQELIDNRKDKHSSTNIEPFKIPYTKYDLYISILFNIKHAIEIFIKGMDFFLREDYNNKSHDIHSLFSEIKDTIRKNKYRIEEELNKMKENEDKLSENLKVNIPIAIKDFSNIDNNLSEAEELVEKYYKCNLIKDKLENNFEVEDSNNTVFRYPDNNLKIILDYEEIGNLITESDIQEILKDIFEMKDIFPSIGFPISIYRKIVS